MQIELYAKYRLKDGRQGWVVDVLGDGVAYVFELDKKGMKDRIIIVEKNEIVDI